MFKFSSLFILLSETCGKNNKSPGGFSPCKDVDGIAAKFCGNGNYCQISIRNFIRAMVTSQTLYLFRLGINHI